MLFLLACTAPVGVETGALDETPRETGGPEPLPGETGEGGGAGETGDTGDTGTAPVPDYCPAAEADLQEVTDTPASPYFVRHPDAPEGRTPTVVYLPGGSGDRGGALAIDRLYLAGADGLGEFRTVVPYTEGSRDFSARSVYERAAEVRDELLACWGGDADRAHVGGTSNGGIGSFALMAEAPEGWASLLGAPGAWEDFDADSIAAALDGRPVYMGVGEEDTGWLTAVESQAEALSAAGADVTFVAFEGQTHVVDEEFDETILFDFWRAAAP
jgi:pimeloyl-ACP methyl ester carboxylesterase